MPAYFPEGNEPLPMDNEMRSLQKINDLFGGGSSSGGGTGLKEIFSGNGDPNGVVTPTVADAQYYQKDSVPPNQVWMWQGGVWI